MRSAIDRLVHDERVIAALPVVVFLCVYAFRAPALFLGDTWLALTAGREVAQHGVPHTEQLTFWAAGHRWIDQQWLGQLAFYEAYRAAGYFGVWALGAACTGGGVALLVATTRRAGIDVIRGAPIGIGLAAAIFPFSALRTQNFAFLWFGAVIYLLERGGKERRWAWLTLPVLALWGNTHGSVLLGVALVAVWALYHAYGSADRRARIEYLALAAGAVVAALITPYGLDIVDYYRSTVGNSAFGLVVTEWQSARLSTSQPVSYMFFVVLVAYGLLLGALHRHVRVYEWGWLALLLYGALHSVRFETWFMATGGIVLARAAIAAGLPPPVPRVPRVHALLAGVALALLPLFVAVAAAQPASRYVGKERRESLTALRDYYARHPTARMFGVEPKTDFFLWSMPELRGRPLIDSRFELLSSKRLIRIGRYVGTGGSWRALLRDQRIAVVSGDRDYRDMLRRLRSTGWRTLFDRNGYFIVARR